MFIDAKTLDEGVTLQSAVCIVGGGVAGITLALDLERAGVEAIVLESGGHASDDETRDLYRGDNIGVPYVFGDGCRSRFLGGSSNCWGGWCGPMRDYDMQARSWVPDSGWPFDRAALEPFYKRAHETLKLGPYNYDIEDWVKKIGRDDVKRYPLPTGRVHDILSQFANPSRMGAVHRDALRDARKVRVLLFANAFDIQTDTTAKTVQQIKVKTLTGRTFHVAAQNFVLASGGIENPRLLLSSNTVRPNGLGNDNDLVGRYFTDHPRLTFGDVKLRPEWRRNKLYDIKFHYLNKAVSHNGTFVSSQFSLDHKVHERESIQNAQVWFTSIFAGEGSAGSEALIRMKHRLHGKHEHGANFWKDLGTMAFQPASTVSFAAARQFQPAALIRKVQLQVVLEPAPNYHSRVTLGSQRDALGMRRVQVDWRLTDADMRTWDRTAAIFADELKQAGVADIMLPEPFERTGLTDIPTSPIYHLGCWHHMGTTRMHDSPRQGVVDRNGLVHGMSNLYVAGSSVFPTYGANFPTITISALAHRLADHLATVKVQTRALEMA